MLNKQQRAVLRGESKDPLIIAIKKQREELLNSISSSEKVIERSENITRLARKEHNELSSELHKIEQTLYILFKAEEERNNGN